MPYFLSSEAKTIFEELMAMSETERTKALKNKKYAEVWKTYYPRRNWPDNVRPTTWNDLEAMGTNVETGEVVIDLNYEPFKTDEPNKVSVSLWKHMGFVIGLLAFCIVLTFIGVWWTAKNAAL